MRILVACEFSGVVREAFSALGHEAWSCDLLPTEIPGNHYQGDIRDILYSGWDLMVAHPPCTRLCNSGVRWLAERNLWQEMREASEFFKLILNAPVAKIAVENPIPHKYAVEIIGRRYDQIIQPYQFGHGETKATCLWLKGLPMLESTNIVEGREQRIHKMSPGINRSHERSRTYSGIANAMAAQWAGCLTQRAPDSLKAAALSLPEMVNEELSEYHNAGIVSDIDAEVIADGLKGEGTFCDECQSKMHYEGWLNDDGSSYRALAVCDNPACQNVFEF